jgi:hypothetical protein
VIKEQKQKVVGMQLQQHAGRDESVRKWSLDQLHISTRFSETEGIH